jgi:hypothetical protein
VREELVHLATKVFTPSAVRNEPLICSGRAAENKKALVSSVPVKPTINQTQPLMKRLQRMKGGASD